MRLARSAAAALLLVLVASAGCRPDAGPAPPNIILISIDTLRADHLGCYGYFRDTSPTIDALAAESILFERMLVPMATTLPSHLSVLTSMHPNEHGVLANNRPDGSRYPLSPRLVSFARVASEAGYETAAFVSAAPLKRDSGIAAGFDTFDEPDRAERSAAETNRVVYEWLDSGPDEPFFLWIHFYDPHQPYEPPPPYDGQFQTDERLEAYLAERAFAARFSDGPGSRMNAKEAINRYDGEIRYLDAQLAALFSRLDEAGYGERSALVLLGDHGEALGQHGMAYHGYIYDEQLNAPLMMRIPGQAPRRQWGVVSAVDVLPTLLSALGDARFDAFVAQAAGRDVLAAGADAPPPILSQVPFRPKKFAFPTYALTSQDWKFVQHPGGRDWLFHLRTDPFELRNVAGEQPVLVLGFRSELEERLEDQARRAAELGPGDEPAAPDPARVEQLRALGYVD